MGSTTLYTFSTKLKFADPKLNLKDIELFDLLTNTLLQMVLP